MTRPRWWEWIGPGLMVAWLVVVHVVRMPFRWGLIRTRRGLLRFEWYRKWNEKRAETMELRRYDDDYDGDGE